MEIVTTLAATDEELKQILELQQKNHFENITCRRESEDGFVTVMHSFELLKEMNGSAPHVIAKQNGKLAGYALVMLRSYGNRIPVLYSLFERLAGLEYNNQKLSGLSYYIMGQVCVAEECRGKGIFDKLYQKHKEVYSKDNDLCITEVSVKNLRSIRAHERIGFKTIHTYKDDADEWNIIAWDWT